MQNDLTDLVDGVRVEQRLSKAGKPYNMLVVDLGGGIVFEYLCIKGEENVAKALLEATKK